MEYYVKIDPSGEVLGGEFGEKENTLGWLQKQVGGYIDTAPIPHWPGMIMILNDEGKLRNLPPNTKATILAGLAPYDFAVGPVVIVKTDNEEFAGMTFEESLRLMDAVRDF